ncbi:MAG: VWA domain-containing protein [Blastocatellia bacterium]
MRILTKPLCFLLLVWTLTAHIDLAAQEQPVRLKADLIEVRAVVTDRNDRVVDNLKAEDFELLENGRPQQISFFSLAKIGNESPTPQRNARAEADPKSLPNSSVASLKPPSRTVVLFVDTLHLSPASFVTAKETLKKFVNEQMTDEDVAAIITSTGQLGVLEQFTRDKQMLRYAIARLMPWARSMRTTLLSAFIAARVINGDREAYGLAHAILQAEESYILPSSYVFAVSKDIVDESLNKRKSALGTLNAVAKRMTELPGQRMLVLLSDGFSLFDAGASADHHALDQTINSAVRSGVIVYSLVASGLQPEFFEGNASLPMELAPTMAHYSTTVAQSRRDVVNTLRDIAEGTGGKVFVNTNDLSGKLQKALNDNRVFYTLAFYPSSDKPDASFHRITVRVKDHPEYSVRAQKGYLPLQPAQDQTAKTPQQKMVQALSAPLPLAQVEVAATASFLERKEDKAQVSLEVFIDGGSIEHREENQRQSLALELAGVVLDLKGNTVEKFGDRIEASLRPERVQQAKQNGYRYGRRLKLKPGTYQIRVGVREPDNEHIGTAAVWVEVPDLRKGKLAMSNIILSERAAADARKSDRPNQPEVFHPGMKQGITVYKTGSLLIYYLALYNAAQTSDLSMQAEIIQNEQSIYRGQWQPVASRAVEEDKNNTGLSGQIPMLLKPGLYELRISVKGRDQKQSLQQSTIFRVEPQKS